MKLIISFILTLTSTLALGNTSNEETLVINTVINYYSYTANYKKYLVKSEDIWDLQETTNVDSNCLKTMTGLVSAPSAYGSSTRQFWVCLTGSENGQMNAEVIDDIEIADE